MLSSFLVFLPFILLKRGRGFLLRVSRFDWFYWVFVEGYKNKIKINWRSFSIVPALLGVGGVFFFIFTKIARLASWDGSLMSGLFSWESAVRSIIDALF